VSTIRQRARELEALASMPNNVAWRLHHIERTAGRAAALAHSADEILIRNRLGLTIPAQSFESLERVAAAFREKAAHAA
jgi:hypothetical protein